MVMIERIKMVKAMEFIARNINNEAIFDNWLMDGVADGDIQYGDLNVNSGDAEALEFYVRSENFCELMGAFLYYMSRAYRNGGLFCDGVRSVD